MMPIFQADDIDEVIILGQMPQQATILNTSIIPNKIMKLKSFIMQKCLSRAFDVNKVLHDG